VFTAAGGAELYRETVQEFDGPGVLMATHNLDKSVGSFARACFKYALSARQDLWFGAKDTILTVYDGAFRSVFDGIYNAEYAKAFADAGINYFYTLIDDAASRAIRSEGGFIWACKNYDGDVMSDLVSTAFGSLAMMTSALASPDGCFMYEAAHGTVTRHYKRYLEGEAPATNPVATIFAWTGALRKRGELDGNGRLSGFADALDSACVKTMESGVMTRDLTQLCEGITPRAVNTLDFMAAIRENLNF